MLITNNRVISSKANNKTSCNKAHFSLGEKFNFQSWKNADVLHLTENVTTGLKKSPFLLFRGKFLCNRFPNTPCFAQKTLIVLLSKVLDIKYLILSFLLPKHFQNSFFLALFMTLQMLQILKMTQKVYSFQQQLFGPTGLLFLIKEKNFHI